jgi:hypothetical protein
MKRSDKIAQIYNNLIQITKGFLGEQDLFPSLDEIDLVDLVNLVNLELKPLNGEYEGFVRTLALSYSLKYNEKDFTDAYPEIKLCLDELIKLC